jgi:hypothetical protein
VRAGTSRSPTHGGARRPSLWKTGACAGAAAAAATVSVAGAASGMGVSLDIGGEAIPLIGFAQLTLICTFVGVLVARAIGRRSSQPRTRLVTVTVALTALSLVPDLTAPAGASTKATLMLTHLVAAAIVIPALASRLPATR